MSFYKKDHPRLTVKFLDPNDNSLLFEVNDRDHMNVGEMFSDTYVSALINQSIDMNDLPENVTVLVVGNFTKV